jgi:molybdate transport system substrate-binding protein
MNDSSLRQKKALKGATRSILAATVGTEEDTGKMRKPLNVFWIATCLSALLLAGELPAQSSSAREITVSAAVSLKDAFEEIGKLFMEARPGTRVVFNFAGSGDLARQIEAGAPVDVFASAAQKDMDDIGKKDLIAANSRRDFAKNGVVLVKPSGSTLPLQTLTDLQKKEITKIVIGNPKTVPAGRYAEEALRHLNLWDTIKDRVIFAEHVRQALDYVARNEVDAGLVYSTDAMARSKDVKVVARLPEGSYPPVVYPIGVIKGIRAEALSRVFTDFVLSAEGQRVLTQYGFIAGGPSR